MSLVALDLPDEIRDWPGWLEQQIVGLELRKLVQQLEIVGDVPASERSELPSLRVILGDNRDALLASGLSCLNEALIVSFVRQPRLLMELQELVLEQGGEYWSNIERSAEHELLVESEKQLVANSIAGSLLQSDTPKTVELATRTVMDENLEREKPFPSSRIRRWFILAAALAAALLIVVIPNFINEQHEGRFFSRINLLSPSLNDGEFLKRLANSIDSDWNQKSENKQALKQQLIDFRDSCEVLLAADLSHLDFEVAAELKTRCRTWREKIDKNIDQLASNVPFIDVQQEANATLQRLSQFLNRS